MRDEVKRGRIRSSQDLRGALHRFLTGALEGAGGPLDLDGHPAVILMLGVNGAGKTTTTAKLAAGLKGDGKQVLMAAADTFRAAAIEQLQEWGRRIDVDVIHQAAGADPAAVVFDAVKAASSRGVDVLLVDTAGRLHTKSNLMDELTKLKRVLEPAAARRPARVAMVLEAPTGQNGSSRPGCSTRRSGSPAWCSPSSTAPPRAASRSASTRSWGCRSSWSAWASRSTTSSPSMPATFVDALVGEPPETAATG